jgi:hypothetical protein
VAVTVASPELLLAEADALASPPSPPFPAVSATPPTPPVAVADALTAPLAAVPAFALALPPWAPDDVVPFPPGPPTAKAVLLGSPLTALAVAGPPAVGEPPLVPFVP